MNDFWDIREPVLSSDFQKLLIEYSGVPADQLSGHVKVIRTKAWKVRKYPCIGSYMFLELSMKQHPAYAVILDSLKSQNDATLLDLGCCIGQDLRKIVFDGVPGEKLTGWDIEPAFFSVGYEAFKDESHFLANFIAGDFLAAAGEGPTSEQPLSRKFDYIHAADFFHLWSWEKQIQAYTKAVLMLKDKPGCILFGRNTGVEKARLLDEGPFALMAVDKDYTWLHDAESMSRLIDQVAENTGTRLDVTIDEQPIVDEQTLNIKAVVDLGWNRRFTFTIRTR